jgi:phenylpyruvate tautomerase PptA (4-oxalocrotonate tautomerase family)
MIDLTVPAGALSEDALDSLADSLMRALLRAERVPEEVAERDLLAWVYVHELPTARVYTGGQRLGERPAPIRLDISIPAGVVSPDDKRGFIEDATRLVLEAIGEDPADRAAAARVWVLFREVQDGWGAGGRLLPLRQIAKLVGASDERLAEAGLAG